MSTTRTVSATLVQSEALSWRRRLRTATYALYRRHGTRPTFPRDAEIEGLVDLIDEGRAEPGAPASLTRVTAEALGIAIVHELCIAARAGRPESELIPGLLFVAVLPYAGADAAEEELTIPPG